MKILISASILTNVPSPTSSEILSYVDHHRLIWFDIWKKKKKKKKNECFGSLRPYNSGY